MDEIIEVSAFVGVVTASIICFVGDCLVAPPFGVTGFESIWCVTDFTSGELVLLCSYVVHMLSVTDPDELLSVR